MMFGLNIKITDTFGQVKDAADKAIFKNVRHAAFSIRKYIQESIKKSDKPSSPGEPVKTRGKRGNVKQSIFVAAEADSAIVGPRYSFVGDAMEALEFGKTRGQTEYEPRPTIGPGLEANADRFASSFGGSIGE